MSAPQPPPGAAGPLLRVPRKTTIYSSGDPSHFCYKVIEGAVRVSRILADGHRQVLDICLPNDTFGLETLDTYTATAEAVGDVVLLRCPRTCIAHLNDERPEIRSAMMLMLSRGVCAAQDHLVMLGQRGAKEWRRICSSWPTVAKQPAIWSSSFPSAARIWRIISG
jgi:CRP-like cAMP-binding protein